MNSSEQHQREMFEAYGYRPGRATVCPRVVVGKRCMLGTAGDCICQRYTRLLDHPRVWLDGRVQVFTSEPYHVNRALLDAFTREMNGLGAEVVVGGVSPCYPGETTMIRVRARTVIGTRHP